jgi:hypothetical protein
MVLPFTLRDSTLVGYAKGNFQPGVREEILLAAGLLDICALLRPRTSAGHATISFHQALRKLGVISRGNMGKERLIYRGT